MFVPMHVAMVAAMRLPVPRTKLKIPSAILCNILLASIAPPNIMALMISQIVQSILDIPPLLSNSSSGAATSKCRSRVMGRDMSLYLVIGIVACSVGARRSSRSHPHRAYPRSNVARFMGTRAN